MTQIETEISYRKAQPIQKVIHLTAQNITFSICPRCGAPLDREYINFCSHCGQKLCWKGFNKIKIIIK